MVVWRGGVVEGNREAKNNAVALVSMHERLGTRLDELSEGERVSHRTGGTFTRVGTFARSILASLTFRP